MSLSLAQSKPPYVRFEYKEVEDRNASLTEGRFVSKSVPYAYITSPGSKDEMEKDAKDWLDGMKGQIGKPGKDYIGQWYDHFNTIYTNWLKGQEIPDVGTPVRTCPIFKPAEVKAILNANIRTLEDLETANEESLVRIGIGGRSIQARAREYMRAGKDVGAVSERVNELTQKLADLEARLEAKDKRIAELTAQITTPKPTLHLKGKEAHN